jgi:hypothetical protein
MTGGKTMARRNWITAICLVWTFGNAALLAQTPILDFDQNEGKWVISSEDPVNNVFSLSDTSDAHEGTGSLNVTVKFRNVPEETGTGGSAVFVFPEPIDLSGSDEIRFWVKFLEASTVNRSLQWFCALSDKPVGAGEEETWQWGPDYDMLYLPADSLWYQIVIPFSRLAIPQGAGTVNGTFDKESVSTFEFGVRADGLAPDSIRFLIDHLYPTRTVQDFALVSFDEVYPDNGWQSNPESNPWNLSINTTDVYEGTGSLEVLMEIYEFEDWGAEAEVGWDFTDPPLNLGGVEEMRFRIHIVEEPLEIHSTRFYLWVLDQPPGEFTGEVWTAHPSYSTMTGKDKNGFWNEVVVPMDEFHFASWNDENGSFNNRVFDLDAITHIALNVGADNPPGVPDIVQFLIDDLRATSGDWESVGIERTDGLQAPKGYRLDPNYPNPFNPATTIRFHLPRPGRVHMTVTDCRGRTVKTVVSGDWMAQGAHSLNVDLSGHSSGIYWITLDQDGSRLNRKITLLK